MPLFTQTKAGILVYRFEQNTPAITWSIVHNFGTKPMVECFVNDGGQLKKAWPLSLEYVDDNTVEITWSQGRSGKATLATHQLV